MKLDIEIFLGFLAIVLLIAGFFLGQQDGERAICAAEMWSPPVCDVVKNERLAR